MVVPDDLIIQRLSGRWLHGPSGRIYNEHFSPPKVPFTDDVTGEPLTRRKDDEPETVKRRLALYWDNVHDILEYMRARGRGDTMHDIECETSKEAYAKLKPIIEGVMERRVRQKQ